MKCDIIIYLCSAGVQTPAE